MDEAYLNLMNLEKMSTLSLSFDKQFLSIVLKNISNCTEIILTSDPTAQQQ